MPFRASALWTWKSRGRWHNELGQVNPGRRRDKGNLSQAYLKMLFVMKQKEVSNRLILMKGQMDVFQKKPFRLLSQTKYKIRLIQTKVAALMACQRKPLETRLMAGFLTVKEASEYLNIKESTPYAWAERGSIPCYKFERLIRFKEDDREA